MFGVFEFNHPIRGLKKYRFHKPLVIPKVVDDVGAQGGHQGYITYQTEPFEVSLILQP